MRRKATVFSLLRRLKRSRKGSAAVEFAIGFPIIIVALAGGVEVGYGLFANAALEGAVREASRRNIACNPSEDEVLAAIMDQMVNFPSDTPPVITTRVYENFGDINEPEPITLDNNSNEQVDPGDCFLDVNGNGEWDEDQASAGLGGSSDVVVFTVDYELDMLFGGFVKGFGSDGSITLQASTAVRNEPCNLFAQATAAGPTVECDAGTGS